MSNEPFTAGQEILAIPIRTKKMSTPPITVDTILITFQHTPGPKPQSTPKRPPWLLATKPCETCLPQNPTRKVEDNEAGLDGGLELGQGLRDTSPGLR